MQKKEIQIPNPILFAEIYRQLVQGKQVKLRIRGSSMLPFIRHNDEVMLTPVHPEDIKKGSVVLAETDELGIVLHRIVEMKGNRIKLLGDGNTNQFEHTSPERILATVSTYYRGKQILHPNHTGWRYLGIVWSWMHPWRRSLLNIAWRMKQQLTSK